VESIDKCTEELKKAILNSREYEQYIYYKSQLEKEPQLKELVNYIRRRTFEVNNNADLDRQGIINETESFSKEYKDAKSNEIANRFLNAELTLCRIIQEINRKIISDLDFNVDFLTSSDTSIHL